MSALRQKRSQRDCPKADSPSVSYGGKPDISDTRLEIAITRAGERPLASGRSATVLLGPKSSLAAVDAFPTALFAN